jgi:hypothetical protein
MTTWECPGCGATQQVFSGVFGVSHPCPKRKNAVTQYVKKAYVAPGRSTLAILQDQGKGAEMRMVKGYG